jgi:hypothetical protein
MLMDIATIFRAVFHIVQSFGHQAFLFFFL